MIVDWCGLLVSVVQLFSGVLCQVEKTSVKRVTLVDTYISQTGQLGKISGFYVKSFENLFLF